MVFESGEIPVFSAFGTQDRNIGMKISRCPTIRSSNHYIKVFKTELKEYPLSNVWATKIKHLKFSESETGGNIKITAAIYNFLVFVCI